MGEDKKLNLKEVKVDTGEGIAVVPNNEYLSKEPFLRKAEIEMREKRLNHSARAVIVPEKNLYSDSKLVNAISHADIKEMGDAILAKESEEYKNESLKKAKEYLGHAQDSFHLLEEIERILDTKEKHGTTQILLAQSASQTEFAVLYHSIMRVYRHSCATSFEREKFIKDDNLILLARSKGLANFLPKDFVRTWKKTRVSMKKGQGRAEQLLTYFKENKGSYQQMIKELELYLAEESRKVAEAKGMNCF